MIETVRNEDEMDVEGAYLEGWCWYLRGEAIGSAGDGVGEAEKVEGEELTKEECWTEAIGSLLECQNVSRLSLSLPFSFPSTPPNIH